MGQICFKRSPEKANLLSIETIMNYIDCTDEVATTHTPFVLTTPPMNISYAPATSVVIAYVREVERTEEYDAECDTINTSFCTTDNPSRTPFAPVSTPIRISEPKKNIRRKLSYSECDLEH